MLISVIYLDNLSFLLESFQAGNRTVSKSIIMVLDKFDMFSTHSKQTLLYNLFDAVQSQQVSTKYIYIHIHIILVA